MKKLTAGTLIVCCLLIFPQFFNCQSRECRENDATPVFRVKIAADQYFQIVREKENWQKSAAALMARINQELQNQGVKAKFEIAEISLWLINEKSETLEEALYDLQMKFPKGDHDLVIGLTRKKFSPKCDAGGYYIFPGYIVARDYAEFDFNGNEITAFKNWTLNILIHEIGHFFDLDHTNNPDSIMYPKALGDKFLEEEIETINEKAREMKAGAP